MKLLITGGTVFVSRYAAEYFVRKGHEVYVLNRGSLPQPEGVRPIIRDRHSIGGSLRGTYFDAVIDITAYTGEDVEALSGALGDIGQYILLSSSAVYPETLPQPFREDMPRGKNAFWGKYGTDKISAEDSALGRYPGAYIVRPPYLYGPMNNLYREAFVFECAEKDRPFFLPGNGEMPLQFFYIEDLCRFFELLLEKRPEERIYNAGNPETVSAAEWARACYAVLGKTPEFISVGADKAAQTDYFPFRDYGYILDVTRQQKLLPALTPLEEGLRRSYEWYRHNRDKIRRKPFMEYIDKYIDKNLI